MNATTNENPTDSDLWTLVRQGSAEAFEVLLRRYQSLGLRRGLQRLWRTIAKRGRRPGNLLGGLAWTGVARSAGSAAFVVMRDRAEPGEKRQARGHLDRSNRPPAWTT